MSVNSDAIIIPQSGESFWDIAGHNRAVKRTENGAHMCKEMKKLIHERAEIERDFAKRLKSWSAKWTEAIENGMEYGTNKTALCVMLNEADQLADVHLGVRDKLVDEIIPQIKDWKAENYKKHLFGGCKEAKTFEEDFHKVQKPWGKKMEKVKKLKLAYHDACRLERTAINQENNAKNSGDVSAEQLKKFQEKVEKCGKEVDLARDSYKASLTGINMYNAKYCEDMSEVFLRTQEFEAKRLSFFKELLYHIHSCLDLSQSKQITSIYADFRGAVDLCDVAADIKWWADAYGTGMPMAWPTFEEYIGEFHTISRKERDVQMAHVGGVADGIKLTAIQRNEEIPNEVATVVPASKEIKDATTENHSDDEWDDTESVTNGAALKKSEQSGGTMVRALYDYIAKEDDEISFKAGDTFVKLRDRDDLGWCSGNVNGRIGLFPDNYVEGMAS